MGYSAIKELFKSSVLFQGPTVRVGEWQMWQGTAPLGTSAPAGLTTALPLTERQVWTGLEW